MKFVLVNIFTNTRFMMRTMVQSNLCVEILGVSSWQYVFF